MPNPCRAAFIASALAAVVSCAVFADSIGEEAQRLIQQGQTAEALKRLDAHLARNPQDAEARFARGLALVQLERSEDAIRVFADLTRDYPQLPEPYNNLAVLYAAAGDYGKAREALEAALVSHPGYITAHENLGDIYAALATAAYDRALQLESANTSVQRKLVLMQQIEGIADTTSQTTAARAPSTAPAPSTATVSSQLTDAANATLQAWAQAWSAKQFDAYFATYARDFAPEGGLSRSAWEAQRRDRSVPSC